MSRSFKKLFAFTVLMHLSTAVGAQEIPPACAQYITFYRACWPNVISFFELKNPAEAQRMKQMSSPADDIEATVRQGIAKNGSLKVAQECASPQTKQDLLGPFLDKVVGPIGVMGGLGPACVQSLQALR